MSLPSIEDFRGGDYEDVKYVEDLGKDDYYVIPLDAEEKWTDNVEKITIVKKENGIIYYRQGNVDKQIEESKWMKRFATFYASEIPSSGKKKKTRRRTKKTRRIKKMS